MNIAIVANGINNTNKSTLAKADFVIAVDHGAHYCYQADRTPDVVIGDMDSISNELMQRLQADKVSLQQYPIEKDYTDLHLALRFAVETYPDSHIALYAVTGARDDMTLANILLLAEPAFVNSDIIIYGEQQSLQVITNDKFFKQNLKLNTTVSLIPLSHQVTVFATAGLKYPLHEEILYFANTRGLSNEVNAEDVVIEITAGILCIIVDK